MKLFVDQGRRKAKERAHTATHLLHAALQQYFPNTKQEGSYVGEDELRFDFVADRLLQNDELEAISNIINQQIYQAYDVSTQTMKYDDAIALGAKAFFADTYGEEVRVVSIANPDTQEKKFLSIELCGGNHVQNTADIGSFVIIRQEAVASGVKRIQAFTGPRVLEKIKQDNNILLELTNLVGLKQSTQLVEKIGKLTKEYSDGQQLQQVLKSSLVGMIAQNNGFVTPIDVMSFVAQYPVLKEQDILQYIENNQPYKDQPRIAYVNQTDGTSIVTIYDPLEEKAKEKAVELGVRGGGSTKKVTGKLPHHFGTTA